MSSAGLGATDIGMSESVGGIALEFYRRIGRRYGMDQTFAFEPKMAESVFREMLAEAHVIVVTSARVIAVTKEGNMLRSVTASDGQAYTADAFIDATYEGDLMALAGISFTIGREANATYGETLNGVRAPAAPGAYHIDPYVIPGDPSSGLLPHVTAGPAAPPGTADGLVQAYNYRLCLTNNPTNRKDIEPSSTYDPSEFEILARWIDAIAQERAPSFADFVSILPIPNGKFDANTTWFFSTDLVGGSLGYASADEVVRAAIRARHEAYQRDFLHFLATDPRVPSALKGQASSYGLCADEFEDTASWPNRIYVREGRRMLGPYVMTELDVLRKTSIEDPIALGSYAMDSHYTQRLDVSGDTRVEGSFYFAPPGPYPISYRSITPMKAEAANLLVPVCVSASHVAYGSIRMEPVYMMLAHAAGVAAVQAAHGQVAVQDVAYGLLRDQLSRDGQKLDWPMAPPVVPASRVVITPSLPSPQPTGTSVAFTALGQGSSNYSYRFSMRAPGSSVFTMVQDYGHGNTWTLPATSPVGTYGVIVQVRTSPNVEADALASTTFTIALPTAPPVSALTVTPSRPSPQVSGTPVLFTAESSGSDRYWYRYWVRSPASSSFTLVRDYDQTPTWAMPTVSSPGTYGIIVQARSNPVGDFDVQTSLTFTIALPTSPPVSAVTVTPSRPSPEVAGTPVLFTAAGSGSDRYWYRYWVRSPASSSFTLVRDYDQTQTWAMPTGSAPGTYGIIVQARSNPIGDFDVQTSLTYTLVPAWTP
jgi:hypothetical protein